MLGAIRKHAKVIVQYGASNLKSTVQLQKHDAIEIAGPNQVKEGSLESSRNQPKAGLTLEHLGLLTVMHSATPKKYAWRHLEETIRTSISWSDQKILRCLESQ